MAATFLRLQISIPSQELRHFAFLCNCISGGATAFQRPKICIARVPNGNSFISIQKAILRLQPKKNIYTYYKPSESSKFVDASEIHVLAAASIHLVLLIPPPQKRENLRRIHQANCHTSCCPQEDRLYPVIAKG